MTAEPILECVPNFSEGINQEICKRQIVAAMRVDGVHLLDYSLDASITIALWSRLLACLLQ